MKDSISLLESYICFVGFNHIKHRNKIEVMECLNEFIRCLIVHSTGMLKYDSCIGWPTGDPNHVKTRPEPEGLGVGAGRVRDFMVRVFSGRVPDGLYDFEFFRGSPKEIEKTRS